MSEQPVDRTTSERAGGPDTRERPVSALGRIHRREFRASVGPLVALAAYSALVDVGTTWEILLTAPETEANVVLGSLAEIHVGVAMAAFALFGATVLAIAALDLGWASTVAGTYLVCSFGLSGTSNLLLSVTGTSPLNEALAAVGVAPAVAIAYGFPVVGLVVGTAVHYVLAGALPWREVGAVWTVVAALVVVLPAIV